MTARVVTEERWFPLQSSLSRKFRVPWRVAEKAYATYVKLYGSAQTLERIAEQGGFSSLELIMLLAGEETLSGWVE